MLSLLQQFFAGMVRDLWVGGDSSLTWTSCEFIKGQSGANTRLIQYLQPGSSVGGFGTRPSGLRGSHKQQGRWIANSRRTQLSKYQVRVSLEERMRDLKTKGCPNERGLSPVAHHILRQYFIPPPRRVASRRHHNFFSCRFTRLL